MPRVTVQKNWKKDCSQWVKEYPLLAVGVFEAGNSYNVPEALAEYFRQHGVIGIPSVPPEPAGQTLEIPE